MSYRSLGQILKPTILTAPQSPMPVLAPSPSAAPATPLARTAIGVSAKPVVSPGQVKQVTSKDRLLAASRMAAKVADKIRAEKMRLPTGAPDARLAQMFLGARQAPDPAAVAARKALDSAENRIRSLALMLPARRLTIIAALGQLGDAQREVNMARLAPATRASIIASIQALRAALAPPARSQVVVAPSAAVRVTPAQATTVQSAVDAAVAKLASAGTPVTEASVKQTAADIIKDVSSDATQAGAMISSLSISPLVVSGTAKTDETKPVETLTAAPLPTESVAALVESSDKAQPVPEPEAEKKEEAAPPSPEDLVAAPPASEEKKEEPAAPLVAPAPAPKSEGLFGIPWMYLGVGAGVLIVGGVVLSRRGQAPTPNRRKRGSKRRSR